MVSRYLLNDTASYVSRALSTDQHILAQIIYLNPL